MCVPVLESPLIVSEGDGRPQCFGVGDWGLKRFAEEEGEPLVRCVVGPGACSAFLVPADAAQKVEPVVGLSETATWPGSLKEYLGLKIPRGKKETLQRPKTPPGTWREKG